MQYAKALIAAVVAFALVTAGAKATFNVSVTLAQAYVGVVAFVAAYFAGKAAYNSK